MIDPQTATETLMTLLLNSGPDAAQSLIKGMVVNGAQAVSDVWHKILLDKPKSYSLADSVAKNPDDGTAVQQLRELLEDVFAQNPGLLKQVQQTIKTGDIKATRGSIAVGVNQGGTITLKNK